MTNSNPYAQLPEQDSELDAAFESDDEDLDAQETTHLTRSHSPPPPQPSPPAAHAGTYDFERFDYDIPPPGSPPPAPGNSNGLVPSFDSIPLPAARGSWFSRFLPTRRKSGPQGPVGGGGHNDGVFANVTAKPAPPVTVTDGDSTFVVPEDARAEVPPSYAAAQADSVPPYWETTVHAPFSSDAAGEMIVDSLATGSLFSFAWNLLISVSFNFVGFLLTYLLHTTHAARFGSRTGLGITLIQYGFALRKTLDDSESGDLWKSTWNPPLADTPRPTFPTAAESGGNTTISSATAVGLDEDAANTLIANATTEWLSFFLMAIGWFIVLTSVLGFWRIKRWESSIISSSRDSTAPADGSSPAHNRAILSRLEQAFGIQGTSRTDFFRAGLGLSTSRDEAEAAAERAVNRAGAGDLDSDDEGGDQETDFMLDADLENHTPEERAAIRQTIENEVRLHADLRAAGLL